MKLLGVIWKELLMVLFDPKMRIAILGPPIFQLFIFTFAATLEVKNVPIGILNRDDGAQSIELVERFRGSNITNNGITFLDSVDEIAPFIDKQKGVMVLSIDQEFSRNLEQNNPATIQLIMDGRKSNTTQILARYVQEIIYRFNLDFTASINVGIRDVETVDRIWFNPNTYYHWYNIPCLVALLSMLICLLITTQSIAREREMGTLDQLLISPLKPFYILAGKMAPGIFIGFAEGLFLMSVGVLLFSVPFTGSFVVYLLTLLIFVSVISGIGLFISSLCSTQQQALLGTFVFMLPSVLLSGYGTPIENMPPWFQTFTYFLPLKYMLIISKGLFLKALPFKYVLESLWPLTVMGIGAVGAAYYLFQRRLS